MLWVDLQYVIVEFLSHTHLPFVHISIAIVLQRKGKRSEKQMLQLQFNPNRFAKNYYELDDNVALFTSDALMHRSTVAQ